MNRLIRNTWTCLCLLLTTQCLVACWEDDVLPPEDTQTAATVTLTQDGNEHQIVYNGFEALKDKPVTVYYNIPSSGDMTKMPVLFIFPGEDRSAKEHMALFTDWARRQKVMLFAFEFPTAYYPTTTEYILGGMNTRQSSEGLTAKEKWNFNYVESFFKSVQQFTKTTQTTFDMWGHSAGAQFVHRFCTFMEDAHVNRAIAANSGWYTMPDADLSFPYGYKEVTDVDWSHQLPKVFAQKLYIQLGGADTSTEGLNNTTGAMSQGSTRLERGQHYFTTSRNTASRKSLPFNWSITIVPNIGHDASGMAQAAMDTLNY